MSKTKELVALTVIETGTGEGEKRKSITIKPGDHFTEDDQDERQWLLDNGAAREKTKDDAASSNEKPAETSVEAP